MSRVWLGEAVNLLEPSLTPQAMTPERQNFSIVLLGAFNPAIFQPLWFSNNGLVPKEEAEGADLQLVHNEVSSFKLGSIQVQINKHRFGITTLESSQGPQARDLALGTISVLEHTPLTSLGLNLEFLFGFPDEDQWHAFGHRLVPKLDWNRFLLKPGMTGVEVQGTRSDTPNAKINVKVTPTAEVPCGVLISFNQHYSLEEIAGKLVTSKHMEAVRILTEDWVPFCSFARTAAYALLDGKLND